jgi:hypothetical protein
MADAIDLSLFGHKGERQPRLERHSRGYLIGKSGWSRSVVETSLASNLRNQETMPLLVASFLPEPHALPPSMNTGRRVLDRFFLPDPCASDIA